MFVGVPFVAGWWLGPRVGGVVIAVGALALLVDYLSNENATAEGDEGTILLIAVVSGSAFAFGCRMRGAQP